MKRARCWQIQLLPAPMKRNTTIRSSVGGYPSRRALICGTLACLIASIPLLLVQAVFMSQWTDAAPSAVALCFLAIIINLCALLLNGIVRLYILFGSPRKGVLPRPRLRASPSSSGSVSSLKSRPRFSSESSKLSSIASSPLSPRSDAEPGTYTTRTRLRSALGLDTSQLEMTELELKGDCNPSFRTIPPLPRAQAQAQGRSKSLPPTSPRADRWKQQLEIVRNLQPLRIIDDGGGLSDSDKLGISTKADEYSPAPVAGPLARFGALYAERANQRASHAPTSDSTDSPTHGQREPWTAPEKGVLSPALRVVSIQEPPKYESAVDKPVAKLRRRPHSFPKYASTDWTSTSLDLVAPKAVEAPPQQVRARHVNPARQRP